MRAPPLLPEETLNRVLRLARFNGLSVLVIAGFFSLVSAAAHDVPDAVFGVLFTGAGAMELHGQSLLRHGYARGTTWLVSSQLYLLAVALAYVAFRFTHLDIEPMRQLLTAEQRENIALVGMTEDQFLRMASSLSVGVFGVVTFFYQGGMALYYHRRRHAINRALAEEPPLIED